MKTNKFKKENNLFFTCFLIVVNLLVTIQMSAQSPYISKVYDFRPAPGQLVNVLPKYEEGDTQIDMLRKVEECLADNNQLTISLGGYGGYVVFGFDHEVQNVAGKYDFKILGNTFVSALNSNQGKTRFGGNCEPGIVMVSHDENGNGLPDDTWYELAGSEFYKSETVHDYEITYYKPDENKSRTPDNNYKYLSDTTYIRWTTNGYGNGYLYRNTFHNQPYYPQWIADEILTFAGAKLADNYLSEDENSNHYVQNAYDWGYADNFPNTDDRSNFNIEWAVDANGNPVHLPSIRFVKVYTGINQYCGWLGETSTEILGAEDLHLTGRDTNDMVSVVSLVEMEKALIATLRQNPVRDNLIIRSETCQQAAVYDISGRQTMSFMLENGDNYITCPLRSGLYLLMINNHTIKFIKQ
jgi:hypothetical protein